MKYLNIFSGLIFCMTISIASQAAAPDSASGELTDKCVYPQQPSIPNGSKASEAELVDAQKRMKAYLAEGNEFIACLDNIETTWTEEEAVEKKPIAIMFHNRVVDDMNEVAELFNSAVRAFKGKNK